MARPKRNRRRRRPPSGVDHFEGETAEDLARALGLDGLTTDSCIQGLFGEMLDEMGFNLGDTGRAEAGDEQVYRVVQMGPGRRNSAGSKPEEN